MITDGLGLIIAGAGGALVLPLTGITGLGGTGGLAGMGGFTQPSLTGTDIGGNFPVGIV